MAAAEPSGINMEMHIEPDSFSDTSPIWQRVRQQLNPARHSLAENILAGLVILLFVVVIVLAATHGGTGGGGGGQNEAVCQAEACLYRSGYMVSLLNRSASPCNDFYSFACGSVARVMPINAAYRERTVTSELVWQNSDKLEAILRSRITRNTPDSYERKIKTLFGTCVDDFRIERVRGALLADLLRRQFYVMNGSAIDNFDFNRELLSAVKTFGASAFFEYKVEPNQMDAGRYTVSIANGGIGMLPAMYLYDYFAKQQAAYKEYLRTAAKLLVGDAEAGTVDPNGVNQRVEQFVADVIEIETYLANFTTRAVRPEPGKPPLAPQNQISLTQMDAEYPPVRWSALFSSTLESGVQGSTKVALMTADYMRMTMDFVKDTIRLLHPIDYNRTLSNYLNWQIIRAYIGDLSSAYVHAKREFEASLSNSRYVYQSRLDCCLERTKSFMLLGLNSLFVADHLVDSSKRAVDSLYKTLQSSLINAIDRLSWISSDQERNKMKAKLQAVVDNIGYSATEVQDQFLDDYYKGLDVDPDFPMLDISISWQNFKRLKQGARLGKAPQAGEWSGATFDVALSMTPTSQLTIPAGILQRPFFSPELPGYINFATIGQRMVAELIKAVDATGQLTDQQGSLNPIWSEDTSRSFLARSQCVNATYSGLKAGPYMDGNRTYYVDIGPIIARTLRSAIAETEAIRLIAKVYAGSAESRSELPLPLGHLDKMQSLFVSWAQTFCYTRDPLYSYLRGSLARQMPEEIHVNAVLSLIPEFQSAFSCPSGSRMVKPGGCEPIFYS